MAELPGTEQNFVGGEWRAVATADWFDIVRPSDESVIGRLPLSSPDAVDAAVAAARRALPRMAATTCGERLAMLDCLIGTYERHYDAMVLAITNEMGAPITVSRNAQAAVGLGLLRAFREALETFPFENRCGNAVVRREPIGVAGLITPWNWPMNQVVCKVGAALAAGCTMVLKPSEYAPLSAALFARIVADAGIPDGVFNMVYGDAVAGDAIARHPDVDMVSITGSTRAGIAVAISAAPTVKRVTQELGGKSPYLVLPGANLDAAVADCVARNTLNCGQSCNAPSRLLVHENDYERVVALLRDEIAAIRPGDPFLEETRIGPLVNGVQFERVAGFLQSGLNEGACLVTGGGLRPDPLVTGYYVEPTVFGEVRREMAIAREEIFGPVLCVMPYRDVDEAVAAANDTEYGLSAYLYGPTTSAALDVVPLLRVGMVHVNGATGDLGAPFGGYGRSGNGRERGMQGIEEYLETKATFI